MLSLAGFYDPPFYTTLEESVEVESQGRDETVRGQIDVLVLQNSIWVVVIESKSVQYDVMMALPQALTYMSASPNHLANQNTFGMITNGREFRFIKLEPPLHLLTHYLKFSLSQNQKTIYT